MNAIVAIDKLWGIGKNNDLLFHIKEDMKFFKVITIGKVVVMGRKTLESLPNGKPLKDRINLVITSEPRENYDNVIFGNLDQINEEIKKYNTDDVFIIGGASIYKQFINKCDTVYVTQKNKAYDADVFMPNLALEGFKYKDLLEVGVDTDDIAWRIVKWQNTNNTPPYKAVLWYKSNNNNVASLYADEFYHWYYMDYQGTYAIIDNLKKFLTQLMPSSVKTATIDKINGFYRAQYNSILDNEVLNIAAFGKTEIEASQNLIMSIVNTLSA